MATNVSDENAPLISSSSNSIEELKTMRATSSPYDTTIQANYTQPTMVLAGEVEDGAGDGMNNALASHLSAYDHDGGDLLEEQGHSKKERKKKERAKTRDLIAFFISGLLNNYSYVIMLSAAGKLNDQAI